MLEGSVKSLLLNGAVSAAMITGVFGIYKAGFEQEHSIRSSVVESMLKSDENTAKGQSLPPSGFRTVLEMGGFGDISSASWKAHVRKNPGSLPRFYHSGYIWSAFYPNLPQIKRAMAKLDFYTGPYDCEIDARFILGTIKLQEKGGKGSDAIFGKGTLGKLDRLHSELGLTMNLEPEKGDERCGS